MTAELKGWVTTATRRYASVVDAAGREFQAKTASRHLALCVGDEITFAVDESLRGSGDAHSGATIQSVLPRKNCLKRQDSRKTKELAVNLDLVLLVTAPPPLFNTSLIDRVLVCASQQQVIAKLVLNKIDLLEEPADFLSPYRALGIEVLEVSAKERTGKEALAAVLNNNALERVVFVGISGVGKSSLLSFLDEGISVKTQNVSEKTGQGRQTTSQAIGFVYAGSRSAPLLLIDLPGIQNFGISHLTKEEVRDGFPEFRALGECQFANCWHLQEPECAVTTGLSAERLARSRYRSYCEMLAEIERNKPY